MQNDDTKNELLQYICYPQSHEDSSCHRQGSYVNTQTNLCCLRSTHAEFRQNIRLYSCHFSIKKTEMLLYIILFQVLQTDCSCFAFSGLAVVSLLLVSFLSCDPMLFLSSTENP